MEQNLRKCKKCGNMRLRILDGKFDSKNKRWKDEFGKNWNGSVCPTCHQDIVRENMKKLRNSSNEQI